MIATILCKDGSAAFMMNDVLKNRPELTLETIRRMEDMSWFTHARIFDDLLVVAQRETACYIWKTSAGLVIFDGIWPHRAVYEAILRAIREAGWNPEEIRKFIITHGHTDHTGCGKWLVQNHGAATYLSRTDDRFWREHPVKPDRPETWKDFDITCYLEDGDTVDCGDKSVTVLGTPGHTPGCLSYLFPVQENGERHLAALFGGATPPWNDPEGTRLHRESIDRFVSAAAKAGADVALSNHTAFDNGLERIACSRNRLACLPNPYILGREGFVRFCRVYYAAAE